MQAFLRLASFCALLKGTALAVPQNRCRPSALAAEVRFCFSQPGAGCPISGSLIARCGFAERIGCPTRSSPLTWVEFHRPRPRTITTWPPQQISFARMSTIYATWASTTFIAREIPSPLKPSPPSLPNSLLRKNPPLRQPPSQHPPQPEHPHLRVPHIWQLHRQMWDRRQPRPSNAPRPYSLSPRKSRHHSPRHPARISQHSPHRCNPAPASWRSPFPSQNPSTS